MARSAFFDTECCDCGETIFKGDDIYFCDDGKLCESCADDREMICDCGEQKKPDYDSCYSCHQAELEDG